MIRLHKMKLQKTPFEKIKNGEKTVELRLNDEKRQKLNNGDFIEFSLIDNPKEKIQTVVTALHHFNSFEELYNTIPKEKLGYKENKTANPADMELYYSKEQQDKYGVVGIEIRVTDLQKFIDAQDYGYDFGDTYETALAEMKKGEKESHWIWYVIPILSGVKDCDELTKLFSIKTLQEAKDYYNHPILQERLRAIISEMLKTKSTDPVSVLGSYIDAPKFQSSMTLFNYISPNDIFMDALNKFTMGNIHTPTENLIKILEKISGLQ